MPNLLTPGYDWVAYHDASIIDSSFILRAHGIYSETVTGAFELDAAPGVFPNGSTLSGDASWVSTVTNTFASFHIWLVVISENAVIYQQMIYAPGDPAPTPGSAPFFVEIPDGRQWVTIELQAGDASGPNGGSFTEYDQIAEVTLVGGEPEPEPTDCFWTDRVRVKEDC